MKRRIQQTATSCNLIHNHGLWMFPNVYARRAARILKKPLIISPRGMLDDWSLRRSRLKKGIAWLLYEKRNLLQAAAFHATSKEEAQSLRNLGLHQPVAVIPNGIDLPELPATPDLAAAPAGGRTTRRLLFMSRLHPKKGLGELLEAWRAARSDFPDWELAIAGPDLGGHGQVFRQQAAELGTSVRFLGALYGPAKTAALIDADLFVLPTHSENFGLVIAEALAHGLPVITSRAAPWGGLVSNRCGWWIDPGTAPLRTCLQEALRTPQSELKAMGQRGRSYVAEAFSWQKVAQQMLSFYEWVLGLGPKPACVEI